MILDHKDAVLVAWRLKRLGRRVVFTNGCFDILHPGHLHLLREAKRLGDFLFVGLNTDESVRRLKGPGRPVNSLPVRARLLEAVRWVDAVVPFSEDTPLRLVKALRPDVLVKGGDYRPEEVVGREFAGRVVIVPYLPGFSTTAFLERVGELDQSRRKG